MKRLPQLDQGNGQLKRVRLPITGFHWFSNFPDRREHLILAGLVEWTLGLWYKHHIAHTTSLCIIGTQDTPIYLRGRQISAAPSIAIIVPFGGVFHALTTTVWQMGRINIMKQRRNAVRVGKYRHSEGYAIWLDGIGYRQLYSQITSTTRGWAQPCQSGWIIGLKVLIMIKLSHITLHRHHIHCVWQYYALWFM